MVGADAHHRTQRAGAPAAARRATGARSARAAQQALELLELRRHRRPGRRTLARNLPYGYQRRLEIARALATQPQLLCSTSRPPASTRREKQELMELIRTIRDQGYTVLLIEHDMGLVMGVTDRIVVLDFGRKIAEGTPAEIRRTRPHPGLPGRPRRSTGRGGVRSLTRRTTRAAR